MWAFKFIFSNLYPYRIEEKETEEKYFSSMSVDGFVDWQFWYLFQSLSYWAKSLKNVFFKIPEPLVTHGMHTQKPAEEQSLQTLIQ